MSGWPTIKLHTAFYLSLLLLLLLLFPHSTYSAARAPLSALSRMQADKFICPPRSLSSSFLHIQL